MRVLRARKAQEEGEEGEEEPKEEPKVSKPSDIGPPQTKSKTASKNSQKVQAAKTRMKKHDPDTIRSSDIWDESELNASNSNADPSEGRPAPEYEILYKQNVGTEDVYLGMGMKSPATQSCGALSVRISLPSTDPNTLDLDVHADHLTLASNEWYLYAPFPQDVDESKGKATWQPKTEQLVVILPIQGMEFMDA
jgi:dynein assembly factor 6, axonemal